MSLLSTCPIAAIRADPGMTFRVRLLTESDPPDAFPDPASARAVLGYPDGLIALIMSSKNVFDALFIRVPFE